MGAIEACRTSALGVHVEQCADRGEIRIAHNSCRNRHCPKCQGLARAKWLADRRGCAQPGTCYPGLRPVIAFAVAEQLTRPWDAIDRRLRTRDFS